MNYLPLWKKTRKYTSQSGQALLIVLLSMAVILTVVLSFASKSITEVSITSYEEDALRAFSAAEAGVEKALLNPIVGPIPTGYPDLPDTSVSYGGEITEPVDSDNRFIYPSSVSSGEVATFWLVAHEDDGSLTCSGGSCFRGPRLKICWETGSPNPRPAIEALVFYDSSTQSISQPTNNYAGVQVWRGAFDRVSRGNGFDTTTTANAGANCTPIDGTVFNNETNIQLNPGNGFPAGCDNNQGCLLLVKVRMYYATNQKVGIWVQPSAGAQLPPQGFQISSTGVAGESTRRVSVFQGYSEPPTLFESAVFSMKDLDKP